MSSSGGTLKPDIRHIIGRPEMGMCSAVKLALEYSQKMGATRQHKSSFLLNKRRLNLSGESVSMLLFLKDNIEL